MHRDWNDFKVLHSNIAGAREAFENACETLFKKIYPETQNGETMIKIIKNMYKTDMHKTNTFMKNSTTSDFEKEALAYIRNI